MKEYIKVDENGFLVDAQLFADEDVEEGYVLSWQYQEEDKVWWKPRFDFESQQWVEGLSEEEINIRVQQSNF